MFPQPISGEYVRCVHEFVSICIYTTKYSQNIAETSVSLRKVYQIKYVGFPQNLFFNLPAEHSQLIWSLLWIPKGLKFSPVLSQIESASKFVHIQCYLIANENPHHDCTAFINFVRSLFLQKRQIKSEITKYLMLALTRKWTQSHFIVCILK